MSFLNLPLFAWLAPLLAVPLAIHLFNRRSPAVFRFSSISQIKRSIAQRSRLFRMRHLLLLLLRTLALALLALMFLKPVRDIFGSRRAGAGTRHAVILFDHSLSMEAADAGVTGRQRGIIEAEKIINALGPNDQVDVVAIERNPRACFPELSNNQADALNFLYHLPAGLGVADFSKAGALAAGLLAHASGGQEVYCISDFQRGTWATADLAQLPASARVFFVGVAPDERPNRALLGARLEQPDAPAGETVSIEVTLGNFSPASFQGKIEARIDDKAGFETDAAAAPWTTAKFKLPVRFATSGMHTVELRLPDGADDSLAQDNRWFLTANVADKETVLVVSDETGQQKRAAFFLGKALDPFEGDGGSVRVKNVSSAQMTGAALSGVNKVFLTSLDPLPADTCKQLAAFLTRGGSIVYFLDGEHDAENLAQLDKSAGEPVAPLRLEERQTSQNIPGGAQQIERGDFKSKYLRIFRGTQRASLGLMEFYAFYHTSAADNGKALLTYTDGSPAMAVSHPGTGTLLACNFSVSELASNLARQRAYPAWIQDLVKTLGEEQAPPRANEVGDRIYAEVWQTDMPAMTLRAPSGQLVRTERVLDVNRYQISFSAEEQGIYQLAAGDASNAWAINCPADESDLRSVDPGMLPQRLAHTRQAHFAQGEQDYEMLASGRPVFHYFALGALALLALELGLFKLFNRAAA
jgi:hypothetical protein